MSAQTMHWPFVPAHRNVNIARADGAYLYTADGQKILDAAGGAIVANIGHGRREVADAVAEATVEASYVVPPWLTPSRERLLERLPEWLPDPFTRVHLACGGSEGVETAMKIALQYHAARGETGRTKIIGRSVSYHGTTLATTAVGGHEARKRGLEEALATYPNVETPYPLRCPLGPHHPDAGRYYVEALEKVILGEGPETIAAFLAEPITGSSGGAQVPPDDYWPAVRALCDRHGILLLMDEVMTGFGRTGTDFGFQHFGVIPDVFVSGKGLAGGYAPIVGVFATDAVANPIVDAGMNVMFHTFGAHPAACAAADAVLGILREEQLVRRAAEQGEKLADAFEKAFSNHPNVAEIRGKGLLRAIEIVADRATLESFPESDNITNKMVGAALKRGVFFYGGGTGVVRDIVCMGPPFIIGAEQIDTMVNVFGEALEEAIQ